LAGDGHAHSRTARHRNKQAAKSGQPIDPGLYVFSLLLPGYHFIPGRKSPLLDVVGKRWGQMARKPFDIVLLNSSLVRDREWYDSIDSCTDYERAAG